MSLSSDFTSMSIVSTEEQARRIAEMRGWGGASDSSRGDESGDGEDDSSSETEQSDDGRHPCALSNPEFKGNRQIRD